MQTSRPANKTLAKHNKKANKKKRLQKTTDKEKGIDAACPLLELPQEIFDLVVRHLGKKNQNTLAKTTPFAFLALLRSNCGFGTTQHVSEAMAFGVLTILETGDNMIVQCERRRELSFFGQSRL
jgi:hypothetical protein